MKLKFDIWFWLLAVWSIAAPYLFDSAHIDSCADKGKVTFIPLSVIWDWGHPEYTYHCAPTIPAGEAR